MNENYTNQPNQAPQEDNLSLILKIVSFLIPLVGAILYFVYKSDRPKSAKSACNMALLGVAVSIILNVIMGLTGGLF